MFLRSLLRSFALLLGVGFVTLFLYGIGVLLWPTLVFSFENLVIFVVLAMGLVYFAEY